MKCYKLPILWAVLLFVGCATADEKWVDNSFSCPVKKDPTVSTCTQVCVQISSDCPASLQCASGLVPCSDGSCQTSCTGISANPCERYMAYSTACDMSSTQGTYSECRDMYTQEYEDMDNCCGDDDDYYADDQVPPDYPGFIVYYAWMSLITVLTFLYFAYNNKINPLGDVRDFRMEIEGVSYREIKSGEKAHNEVEVQCSQTGFRETSIGWFLYISCLLTMLGLQIVLLLLVIAYYFILNRADIEKDTPNLNRGWSPFVDASQALYAFEIAWAVGFVWVLTFKRPTSLHSSFLRRCPMADASYVAVFIPFDDSGTYVLNKDVTQTSLSLLFRWLFHKFDSFFVLLFSEVHARGPGVTEYLPVQTRLNTIGNCHQKISRFIDFRLRRYQFNADTNGFEPMLLDVGTNARALSDASVGLTSENALDRETKYGQNIVRIGEPVFWRILLKEFTRVFYVYQNFMTWTWINYGYWHMGIVNTLVYSLGGLVVSYVKYKNDVRLRELSRIEGSTQVLRDGAWVTVEQTQLVPGDVIEVADGPAFCDMMIISGECLVDESCLTGESMPVVKTALDPTLEGPCSPKHQKHHAIFAGTSVMTEEDVHEGEKCVGTLAVVVRTGSHTLKGELLRDILFGPIKQFKFDVEVKSVLVILLCYAIFGFSMTIYFLKSDPVYGFFYAIYVVASALPPLLPTVFIVSEGISADRLLAKGVAVSDSHSILMAGKVRVAFFDKTGTLTSQGLDFESALPTTPRLGGAAFDEPCLMPCSFVADPTSVGAIARAMGMCHRVKKVHRNQEDIFIGNAIDLQMFEASGFVIENGNGQVPDVLSSGNYRYSMLRQFDFDSRRKIQSVIVRDESSQQLFLFTKGSGEAVRDLCLDTSLPTDFDEVCSKAARSGIYQISIGWRPLSEPINEILKQSRDQVEGKHELIFLGFVNFSNRLKEETPAMLRVLREGGIRTVMISGDHVLTAIHVARQSGMLHMEARVVLGKRVRPDKSIEWVDERTDNPVAPPSPDDLRRPGSDVELAMVGSVWDHLVQFAPQEAQDLAHFVRVIGRCTPADKISIVNCFNQQGFITLMCGDGGNDCGALRTAHVGIALSDAEASVVSPFTSINKDITAVVTVLKEGRCTLASAISSYKYMIMYGQVETINQIVCAWFSITFSEWCWVFMDGFWVISMAFSLPFADVADKLAPERPTSSILGPHTLSSVLGVLAINFGFTVLALGLLFGQDWFKCRKWVEGSVADVTSIGDNYETEVVFIVSGYQYISSAMAYNFGFKHRAGWLKNWRFVLFVIAWTVIHFTIVLYPSTLSCFFRVNCDNDDVVRGATVHVKTPIQNPWNTTVMPVSFRYDLLIIIIMNAVALSIWEYFFVNGPAADYIKSFFPRQNRLLGGLGFQGTVKGEAAPLEDGSARLLAMVELEGGVIGHRERRSVDSVHPDPVPDN